MIYWVKFHKYNTPKSHSNAYNFEITPLKMTYVQSLYDKCVNFIDKNQAYSDVTTTAAAVTVWQSDRQTVLKYN